jgi:hypothetical protein
VSYFGKNSRFDRWGVVDCRKDEKSEESIEFAGDDSAVNHGNERVEVLWVKVDLQLGLRRKILEKAIEPRADRCQVQAVHGK